LYRTRTDGHHAGIFNGEDSVKSTDVGFEMLIDQSNLRFQKFCAAVPAIMIVKLVL